MPKRSTSKGFSQWLLRVTILVLVLSAWTSQAWIPIGAPPPLISSTDALSVSNPATLWGLRITSALVSYIGLVAFLDRPRGTLFLSDDQYEIKPSQVENAGLGFYVTEPLPKGTMLGTYPGVLLPLNQNLQKLRQYPPCEAYIWRFSDSKFICDPTDARGEIQSLCTGGNPSVPLSMEICSLLAKPVSTALTRINEPPKGRDINVVTQENLNDRTTTFVLERDVYAGEELFMDYGITYDRSGYGGSILPKDESKL